MIDDTLVERLIPYIRKAQQAWAHADVPPEKQEIYIHFNPPINGSGVELLGKIMDTDLYVDTPPPSTRYRYAKMHDVTAYQWFPGRPVRSPDHSKRITQIGKDRYRFQVPNGHLPLVPGDWLVYDHDGGYTTVVTDEDFKKQYQAA